MIILSQIECQAFIVYKNPWGLFFHSVEKYSIVIFLSDPVFLSCMALFYTRTG